MAPRRVEGVDRLLHASLRRLVVEEVVTNTVYYPIVLVMMELTAIGWEAFLRDPALYALVAAVMTQATFVGVRKHADRPAPLLGNLVAPAIYTALEAIIEGPGFFDEPRHVAFWAFALTIGTLQQLRLRLPGRAEAVLHVIEGIVRTSILAVGYWIFRATTPAAAQQAGSLGTLGRPDTFMALTVLFIGLSIGLANVTAASYLNALRQTSARLRVYSEWLLGRQMLAQAIDDPSALALQRRHRAVFFMDIRDFTRWSEAQPAERVVQMLNDFFAAGEGVWLRHGAIKAKPSADEVMVVFRRAESAVEAVQELRSPVAEALARYGLCVGMGLHCGSLIEGVLGSRDVKAYDVIGDVVNTAKRICDQAEAGELLISEDVYRYLDGRLGPLPARQVVAKGKSRPITVYALPEAG